MEEESPPLGDAEADASEPALGERHDEPFGRLDGVVGDAEAAREHVGRSARQGGQRGSRACKAVGGFAERAVAGQHGDGFNPVERGAAGDAGGVAAP